MILPARRAVDLSKVCKSTSARTSYMVRLERAKKRPEGRRMSNIPEERDDIELGSDTMRSFADEAI
jgi:hypothetical protein